MERKRTSIASVPVFSDKIRLDEVASLNPCVELGPEEFFVAPYKRMMKLCRRFWGLGPSDFWQDISENARIEYGHIVEVRVPELSDKPFDTLTGPFKFVDTRILTDQIPLTHPEPTALLRYRSGRTDRLLTLTKLFKISMEPVKTIHRGSIIPDNKSLEKRAKWYRKKTHKKIVGKKPEPIMDDEIGELIAMIGNAACGSSKEEATLKSVDDMVNRWKEIEESKKMVVYESSSDSTVSANDDAHSQAASLNSEDGNGRVQDKKKSCWRRFWSRLCCYCCCGKRKSKRTAVVGVQPVPKEVPMTLTEDEAYQRRKFLEEQASERRKTMHEVWRPNANKVVQMNKGVNAFQILFNDRWLPVAKP